jgi:tetratricopeptide (TPR) repeat protein
VNAARHPLLIFTATLLCAVLFGADARAEDVERLGSVDFAVSCAPRVRRDFERGVALLHDFWYEEARPQFERILKADPQCAMAHWGVAMSVFHQIWDRPDDAAIALAWSELEAAVGAPAKTARERAYVSALREFFRPDARAYAVRIGAYEQAMEVLHARYPKDTDAAAWYALALLAAEPPNDTSLTQARRAMDVLRPLFARFPDHPGVVHYIIHACDTPALASDGLAAARHYGKIAGSSPHAAHMPGHIFSRLGLWEEDIEANAASVRASEVAESKQESGAMDQFHSDDFLLYAYLQSGEDEQARAVVAASAGAIAQLESMPAMNTHAAHYMTGMFPYYRVKLPVFLALEMRDWESAAALEPVAAAPPDSQVLVYWARVIALGHLRRADRAQTDLDAYEALEAEIRKGDHAYLADSTGARIRRGEMQAWVLYARGDTEAAIAALAAAADLQDQVGQGEVDIPAREMLGDILLDARRPKDALAAYRRALTLSPNRFNGLFQAGTAAEAAGDREAARTFYQTLLEITRGGTHSSRPEIVHAREIVAAGDPSGKLSTAVPAGTCGDFPPGCLDRHL